jgi:uncharacterized protein YecT (DUF1311 family)
MFRIPPPNAILRGIFVYAVVAAVAMVDSQVARAGASNCDGATTLEIGSCMKDQQAKNERELNVVYSRVMKLLSQPDTNEIQNAETKRALVAAQRAWVTFRKQDCDALYSYYSDGTIRSLKFQGCMISRTESRIKELKEFLGEGAD